MKTKFGNLPAVVQAMIVGLVAVILAVWAGAFVYSYNALYAVGNKLQNTDRVAWMWPFLLDGQIVAANFGLALATAFERDKGLMKFWVALSLAGSVGFNIWHVVNTDNNRVLWLVAAVAPITIEGVCFVGVKVLEWTLQALGKPTSWQLPDKQVGVLSPPPQTTVVRLPDGTYGVPGSPFPGYGAGTFPPQGPFAQMPSALQQQTPQLGHASEAVELPEATKRQAVEMYLSGLPPEQAGAATRSSVAAALNAIGVAIDETYAGRILGEWRVAHPANNGGNGTKPPKRSLRKQQG